MLKMKVNKKLLQQHLSEVTSKIMILKDITNIHTTLASGTHSDETISKYLWLIWRKWKVLMYTCTIIYCSLVYKGSIFHEKSPTVTYG